MCREIYSALVDVSCDCVVFSEWGEFSYLVSSLLPLSMSSVVLFSAYPNLRYVRTVDAVFIAKHVFWHEETRRVILCVSSNFLVSGVANAYAEIISLRLFKCVVRLSGNFSSTRCCIWELFVDDLCFLGVPHDIEAEFTEGINCVVRKSVELYGFAIMDWLKEVFSVLDDFQSEKRAVYSCLKHASRFLIFHFSILIVITFVWTNYLCMISDLLPNIFRVLVRRCCHNVEYDLVVGCIVVELMLEFECVFIETCKTNSE